MMNGCRYEHPDRLCHRSETQKDSFCEWCVEGPCPYSDPDTQESLENQLISACRRIEALTTENLQLRTVLTQIDPEFFSRKCRVCGCDWNHPCNDHDCWVESDLCSACFTKMMEERNESNH